MARGQIKHKKKPLIVIRSEGGKNHLSIIILETILVET